MNGDALTTKEAIKERLSITNTEFDDLFDRMILSVTARIQQMTNRRFIQATYSNELYHGSDIYGTGRSIIILKNGPVHSVAQVQYKAGLNSVPNWTTISPDLYDVDYENGLIVFDGPLPRGQRNIRVTYTGGFSGFTMGINNFWLFNVTPTGAVNGTNLTFTLPEDANQLIVTVDGVREVSANITFTAGTDTFTLAAGRAPSTTIVVDYLRAVTTADDADYNLPADLVDVAERAVMYLFKTRDMEGRTTESFGESSVTWRQAVFTPEMLATVRNYRRGDNL